MRWAERTAKPAECKELGRLFCWRGAAPMGRPLSKGWSSMAEIRKVGIPSVSSVLTLAANRINGSLAGEDIAAADACYIDDAGRVWRSRGAAPGPTADVRGFAATAA